MVCHFRNRSSVVQRIRSGAIRRKALSCARQLHQSPQRTAADITSVAVLGGGITGLAATYYLSKWLPPSTQIRLFESSPRLGGWIGTTKVDVDNGHVVFENGPRSLRPAGVSGLIALDLIAELGLGDQIISTLKDDPAARNRYIYYPDHLVCLPGPGGGILRNLRTFFTEPIFDGIRAGVLSEVNKPKRSSHLQDESIGDFISRRFGHELADNIVSAVFHGIYAGDVYKLSARSIIPTLWHMEDKHTSIVRALLEQGFGREKLVSKADLESEEDQQRPLAKGQHLLKTMGDVSLFTLRNGLGALTSRLSEELSKANNVVVSSRTEVQAIKKRPQDPMLEIECKGFNDEEGGERCHFSHLISTLRSPILAGLLGDSSLSKIFHQSSSVSVIVVNLFFEDAQLLPVHGFGYLLPRSLPLEQNPEAALGVIFDTDALPQQDKVLGTKLTVIFGGHWWSGWNALPSSEDALRMAKSTLARHLGITKEAKAVQVTMQKNCIPQYQVGHDSLMSTASHELEQIFDAKLRVAGSSYSGVGVNDCIRSARDVVKGLVDGTGRTGLDTFAAGRPWIWMAKPPKAR